MGNSLGHEEDEQVYGAPLYVMLHSLTNLPPCHHTLHPEPAAYFHCLMVERLPLLLMLLHRIKVVCAQERRYHSRAANVHHDKHLEKACPIARRIC